MYSGVHSERGESERFVCIKLEWGYGWFNAEYGRLDRAMLFSVDSLMTVTHAQASLCGERV